VTIQLDQIGQVGDIPAVTRTDRAMKHPKKKTPGKVAEPLALYDAKTRLSELVDLAAAGEEFVIAKSGTPMAKLVPYGPAMANALRKPGKGKGRVWVAKDFDAPLPPEVVARLIGD
jgi:prevent-host-death family protein